MTRDLTMKISAIAGITRRARTGSPIGHRHMRRVARCNATGRLRGRSGADRCNVGQAVERGRSGPRRIEGVHTPHRIESCRALRRKKRGGGIAPPPLAPKRDACHVSGMAGDRTPPWGGEAPPNCQTGERRQIDDRGHGAADISPAALSYPPCKQACRPAIDAPGDASGCAHYPAQVLGVVAVQVTLHEGMQVECTRVLRIKTGEHALPLPVLRPAYETHVDAMP